MTDGQTTDPVLDAFLRAPDADAARRELEIVLVDVARPIVRAIVRATFPPGERNSPPIDADDVEQTVLTTLTASLMRLRSPDPPSAIRSLPDYAAVVTYNTCHAVLRVRAPGRARLRAHMRYVLTHDAALQVIDAPGHRKLAALRRWSGPLAPAPAEVVDAVVARKAGPRVGHASVDRCSRGCSNLRSTRSAGRALSSSWWIASPSDLAVSTRSVSRITLVSR